MEIFLSSLGRITPLLYNYFHNVFRRAVEMKYSHLLILGDFNYGGLNWELQQSSDNINDSSSIFMETVNDLFLYQHVGENTRYRGNQTPSRLDLIFTNECNMITDLDYLPPIGASDHSCLLFNFVCYSCLKQHEPRPNFYKGNYQVIRDALKSTDWSSVVNESVEVFWNNFHNTLSDVIDEHVPKSKPGNRAKKKPWLNRDAILAVESKKRAWKKYKNCKSVQNYQKYAEIRNKATNACRNAKAFYEKELAVNIKTDTKSFWNYVRSQSKTSTSIGELENESGLLTSSDTQKAEILNAFFSSVFIEESTENMPDFESREFESVLTSLDIDADQVKKKLSNIKTSKSPGIDCIHPLMLKECSDELADPLAKLFNLSIKEEEVPEMWRKALVAPLFKKGEKHKSSNYRPVSLTVIICKLLETFVRDKIMSHIELNNFFSEHQHGFRARHSCVTQLIEVIEHWTEILEQGGSIDCIYLDFAKAFDTVPHQRLLKKLSAYGIRGNILGWIRSFLSNRQQKVKVGSSCSDWVQVKSGIRQGSVLGPTLFLIYINDLPEVVSNVVKLFADDTKIYRNITDSSDMDSLQQDINNLQTWSEDWLIRFNASKCKCIHLGKRNPKHSYSMGSTYIEETRHEKDLGVTFDDELSFSEHIALKVKKANQALGMIRRTFTCMDRDIFIPLFKTLVRPHLEYASVIWSPKFKKDNLAIENVQRRATKMVTGMKNLTYEERLRSLGLPTLVYRRQRADMIQLFKILHKYESVNIDNIKINTNTNRGHSFKLQKQYTRTASGQNRFSFRSINHWNSLSPNTVTASSVNVFKSELNKDWKVKSDKFHYQ